MIVNKVFDQFSLAHRNFVVTGASSGIGRAIAGFLAKAGATAILLARRQDELETAVDEIRSNGDAKTSPSTPVCVKTKLKTVSSTA
jgi:NADP-dependent 3-hydroxy acid dehydrogenase YdfG